MYVNVYKYTGKYKEKRQDINGVKNTIWIMKILFYIF